MPKSRAGVAYRASRALRCRDGPTLMVSAAPRPLGIGVGPDQGSGALPDLPGAEGLRAALLSLAGFAKRRAHFPLRYLTPEHLAQRCALSGRGHLPGGERGQDRLPVDE